MTRVATFLRGFLGNPSGWLVFLVVEWLVLYVLLRGALPRAGDSTSAQIALGIAVLVVVGSANYLLRRRFLRADDRVR